MIMVVHRRPPQGGNSHKPQSPLSALPARLEHLTADEARCAASIAAIRAGAALLPTAGSAPLQRSKNEVTGEASPDDNQSRMIISTFIASPAPPSRS